jgi:hypothetical protein
LGYLKDLNQLKRFKSQIGAIRRGGPPHVAHSPPPWPTAQTPSLTRRPPSADPSAKLEPGRVTRIDSVNGIRGDPRVGTRGWPRQRSPVVWDPGGAEQPALLRLSVRAGPGPPRADAAMPGRTAKSTIRVWCPKTLLFLATGPAWCRPPHGRALRVRAAPGRRCCDSDAGRPRGRALAARRRRRRIEPRRGLGASWGCAPSPPATVSTPRGAATPGCTPEACQATACRAGPGISRV